MLSEAKLFDAETERYVVDRALIDQVALPLGDRYDDELFSGYFADYAGMARKFKPKRIFEIGVRYGYTGIVFMLGLRANRGQPKAEYLGIDDESYHLNSCAQANANFVQALPGYEMRAINYNSFNGPLAGIGTFDLIHVDAHHSAHAVTNDLNFAWGILNPGGIIICDDAAKVDDQGNPGELYVAIHEWLAQFVQSPLSVKWWHQTNQRCHIYIQKGKDESGKSSEDPL